MQKMRLKFAYMPKKLYLCSAIELINFKGNALFLSFNKIKLQ